MEEIQSDIQQQENDSTSETLKTQRFKYWQLLVWVAVLLLLILVGLMLLKRQQGSLQINRQVPDFSLTTYDGQEISLSSLKGKVILVNFWASWCIPCEEEAEDLESAWRYYQDRDDVLFLGIAWTDTDRNALEYLEKFSVTYPNGPDLGTRISQKYRITGVPETFVIDRDGNLAYFKFSPFLSVEEIRNVIDPLLLDQTSMFGTVEE